MYDNFEILPYWQQIMKQNLLDRWQHVTKNTLHCLKKYSYKIKPTDLCKFPKSRAQYLALSSDLLSLPVEADRTLAPVRPLTPKPSFMLCCVSEAFGEHGGLRETLPTIFLNRISTFVYLCKLTAKVIIESGNVKGEEISGLSSLLLH